MDTISNFALNSKAFYDAASNTSKNHSIEAFCFTHNFGLNIYFDDLDDLKAITKDVEFEFWSLDSSLVEVDVDNMALLGEILELIENGEDDNISLGIKIMEDIGIKSLSEAIDWHNDNYFCENMNNLDFGYFLAENIEEIGNNPIIRTYFNYESYGRDKKTNSFVVIGDNIYWNA